MWEQCVVRAKIRSETMNIIVNDQMMENCSLFISEALRIHGITGTEQLVVKFFDNYGASVDKKTFPLLVRQFYKCNDFYFEIEVTSGGIAAHTDERLEKYLKTNECQSIFAEESRNKFLSRKSKKILLKKAVDFVVIEFSLHPTQEQIIDVCIALIGMFKSLKIKPSQFNGIDLLYNANKRSVELYEKLVYRQRSSKRTIERNPDEQVVPENILINKFIDFFKTCLIPEQNDELINALKESVEQRKADLLKNKDILKASLHLYIINPKLINTDYEIMFGDHEADALLKVWPLISNKPTELFKIDLNRNIDVYHKDDDRYKFLTFLKLLPVYRTKFENAVGSIFTFVSDPNQDLMSFTRDQSVQKIIVVDTIEGTNHYILVQGSVLKVPPEFTFIQVVDLFWKMHKVFNLQFDKAINQLMLFIEYFIFKSRDAEGGLTTKTKGLGKSIFTNLS